jgi:hypothetical protein
MGTYHRLDQLDAVVLWWVVRGRDHEPDPSALQRPRPQRCNEADPCQNRIEDVAAAVSRCPECRLESYAFVRNCRLVQHHS